MKVSVISGTPEEVAAYQRLMNGADEQVALESVEARLDEGQQQALAMLRRHRGGWMTMAHLGELLEVRMEHARWICGRIFREAPELIQRRTSEGRYEYKAR